MCRGTRVEVKGYQAQRKAPLASQVPLAALHFVSDRGSFEGSGCPRTSSLLASLSVGTAGQSVISILYVWLLCLTVCLCTVYMLWREGQKRALNHLKLQKQPVVSRYGMLGIEPQISSKATNTLQPPSCLSLQGSF